MNLRNFAPRLFDIAAAWLIRRARRTPYTHLYHADESGRPAQRYMLRHWLFQLGRSGKNGEKPWLGARVHIICSSDDDRAFHDHPWSFVSIMLRGQYTEVQPVDYQHSATTPPGAKVELIGDDIQVVTHTKRIAGDIAYRSARSWHMVRLAPNKTAITLFITFPTIQSWGFLVREGRRRRKVDRRDFQRARNAVVVVKP